MVPSTPPRSSSYNKNDSNNNSTHLKVPSNNNNRRLSIIPSTPQRSLLNNGNEPVTPMTVQPFKGLNNTTNTINASNNNNAFSNNPNLGRNKNSPFKTFLKSPEYTPKNTQQQQNNIINNKSQKRNLQNILSNDIPNLQINNNNDFNSNETCIDTSVLKSVTPVSFPTKNLYSILKENNNSDDLTLNLNDFDELDFDYSPTKNNKKKIPKNVPGTPSDKIITFEKSEQLLISNLNKNKKKRNDSISSLDSNSSEHLITHSKLSNPFLSDSILSNEDVDNRKSILLKENPNIESTITYVNKNGNVIKTRQLNESQMEKYKPRRLFTKELEDSMKDR